MPLPLFVQMHATMDREAFLEKQRFVFTTQEEVHVEALGNPLQAALSLASCYCFTGTAATRSHCLERQPASGSPSGITAAVASAPREPVAATAAGRLLPEVENAGTMAFAAGGEGGRGGGGEADAEGRKEEDSGMSERSLEKRCAGGEGESCFFTEVEERSRRSDDNNNNNGSRSSNGSMRGASSSASLVGSGGQQQQQETSCEEEVSGEEEVETADGTSTATEGETEADSELYYSEESDQERDEEKDQEEGVYDRDVISRRSVAFCDAFAGLKGRSPVAEWDGKQQQPQQARTAAATQSAVATPTWERGKRKFASASCETSGGMMVSQEHRGRKGEEEEEGFDLQSKRPADVDVEEAAEHRQSSRRSRRETVHTVQEPLLERRNSLAASSRAFYSPGCKRRNSRSARDAGINSSNMQWQSSKRRDVYSSSMTSQQKCSSSAESTDAMLAPGGKRRNRSRSLGALRAKVRRRVSETETRTVASSGRAAANVIAGSREHFSVTETVYPVAAATGQVEAAGADPLTRLARRTEELLLMHSKRFMEEQQK